MRDRREMRTLRAAPSRSLQRPNPTLVSAAVNRHGGSRLVHHAVHPPEPLRLLPLLQCRSLAQAAAATAGAAAGPPRAWGRWELPCR